MQKAPIEEVAERIDAFVSDPASFEARYGKRALLFLRGLPGLYRLYRRLPYVSALPREHRHRAAAIALYIVERQDYLRESSQNVGGLMDDLWLAYRALPRFVHSVGEDELTMHWRSELALSEAIALAENVNELEQHVPYKVLEKLQEYLD